MSLVIKMPPEAEVRLREKARRQGLEAEEYVRNLLEREVDNGAQATDPSNPSAADIKKRLQAWREFAQNIPDYRVEAGLPPLSDEDISRETIYAERGLVDGEL